jgi:hypothetical protein
MTLAPGMDITLTVTARVAQDAHLSASLAIFSLNPSRVARALALAASGHTAQPDPSDEAVTLPLSVCGPRPILRASAQSVDFGTCIFGERLPARFITVSNQGTAPASLAVRVSSPDHAHPAQPHLLDASIVDDPILPPGSSRRVKIAVRTTLDTCPLAVARITIEDTTFPAYAPAHVMVSFSVLTERVEIQTPSRVLLDRINFGPVYFGHEKVASAVVANSGPRTVSFVVVAPPTSLPSSDAALESTLPAGPIAPLVVEGTLAPSAFADLPIRFVPQPEDRQQGWSQLTPVPDERHFSLALSIVALPSQRTQSLVVEGLGVPVHVSMGEDALAFGPCPVGSSLQRSTTIRNCSAHLPVHFDCARVAHFSVSPSSGLLAPGEQMDLIVSFTPRQLGEFSPSVSVKLAHGVASTSFKLSGVAVLPTALSAELLPSAHGGTLSPTQVAATSRLPTLPQRDHDDAYTIESVTHRLIDIYPDPDPTEALYKFTAAELADYRRHRDAYVSFLRTSRLHRLQRQARDAARAAAQGDPLDDSDVDLGMAPFSGMRDPQPHIDDIVQPLPPTAARASPAQRSAKARMVAAAADQSFLSWPGAMQLAQASSPLLTSPTADLALAPLAMTPGSPAATSRAPLALPAGRAGTFIRNQIRRELTPLNRYKIACSHSDLSFGRVSVSSTMTRHILFANDADSAVEIALASDLPDISSIEPSKHVLPCGAVAVFAVTYAPSKPIGPITGSLTYTINGHHSDDIGVQAEATQVSLSLSTSQLVFGTVPDAHENHVSEFVKLCNDQSTALARFTWTCESGPGACLAPSSDALPSSEATGAALAVSPAASFTIMPASGCIAPGQSLDCRVFFSPGRSPREQAVFRLSIQGGESTILHCLSDLGDTRATLSTPVVDFGLLAVGQRVQHSFTLQNHGRQPMVFTCASLYASSVGNRAPGGKAAADVVDGIPGLCVSPSHGRIAGHTTTQITLSYVPQERQVLDAALAIHLRGSPSLMLQLRGAADNPSVDVDESRIDFGTCQLGIPARAPLTLFNRSRIPAQITIDLSDHPDFSIVPSDRPADPGTEFAEEASGVAGSAATKLSPAASGPAPRAAVGLLTATSGRVYRIFMPNATVLPMCLVFKPSSVSPVSYELPIFLTHTASSTHDYLCSRWITAAVAPSLLRVSAQTVSFGSCFIPHTATPARDGISTSQDPAPISAGSSVSSRGSFIRRLVLTNTSSAPVNWQLAPSVGKGRGHAASGSAAGLVGAAASASASTTRSSPSSQARRLPSSMPATSSQPSPRSASPDADSVSASPAQKKRSSQPLIEASSSMRHAPQGSAAVFSLQPNHGALMPGAATTVDVLFVPPAAGTFAATLAIAFGHGSGTTNVESVDVSSAGWTGESIHTLSDRIIIDANGTALFPYLAFDRPEVVLPTVPTGFPSVAAFEVIAYGYPMIRPAVRLPADRDRIPLRLIFPEGDVFRSTAPPETADDNAAQPVPARLPVLVVLESATGAPVSFTAPIEFYDNSQRVFSLLVSGAADNSMLSLGEFFSSFSAGLELLPADDERSAPFRVQLRPAEPSTLASWLAPFETTAHDLPSAARRAVMHFSDRWRSTIGLSSPLAHFSAAQSAGGRSAHELATASTRSVALSELPSVSSMLSPSSVPPKARAGAQALRMASTLSQASEVRFGDCDEEHECLSLLLRLAAVLTNDSAKLASESARVTDTMERWLSSVIFGDTRIVSLPGAFVQSHGKLAFDVLEHLAGVRLGESGPPLQFTFSNSTDAVGRARTLVSQYGLLLTFLKQHGAVLPGLQPYMLLSAEDFGAWNQARHRDAGPPGQDLAAHFAHVVRKFDVLSARAWTQLLVQMARVFFVSRVTPALFVASPIWSIVSTDGTPRSSAQSSEGEQSAEATSGRNPVLMMGSMGALATQPAAAEFGSAYLPAHLRRANCWSASEAILLRWLSVLVRYRALAGNARENRGGSGTMSSGPLRYAVYDLHRHLRDGCALAAALEVHASALCGERLVSVVPCSSESDTASHNATCVTNALRDVAMVFPVRPDDLLAPSTCHMILFCASMFMHLPHLWPRAQIRYQPAALHVAEQKIVRVSHQARRAVTYQARIVGSSQFRLASTPLAVTVPAHGSTDIPVAFEGRFSRSDSATLLLVAQSDGPATAQPIVFSLHADAVALSRAQETMTVTSPCYQTAVVRLQLRNPFDSAGTFAVRLSETSPIALANRQTNPGASSMADLAGAVGTRSQRNLALTRRSSAVLPTNVGGAAPDVNGLPPTFWTLETSVQLAARGSATLSVFVCPLEVGRYECHVDARNEEIGEWRSSIVLHASLPPAMELIKLQCTERAGAERAVRLGRRNGQLEQALLVYAERVLGLWRPSSRRVFVAQPPGGAVTAAASAASLSGSATLGSVEGLAGSDVSAAVTKRARAFYDYLEQFWNGIARVELSSAVFSATRELRLAPCQSSENSRIHGGRNGPLRAAGDVGASSTNRLAEPANGGRDVTGVGATTTVTEFVGVGFEPHKLGSFTCRMIVRGAQWDTRVVDMEGTCVPAGIEAVVSMRSPARRPLVQELSVSNPGGHDASFKVTFSGSGAFSGPPVLVARSNGVSPYALKFQPSHSGVFDGRLVLVNQSTGLTHSFVLQGVGEAPLCEANLRISCTAREPLVHRLRVANVCPSTELTYRVETTLDCLKGAPTITVSPGDVGHYEMTVCTLASGEWTGTVTFVADESFVAIGGGGSSASDGAAAGPSRRQHVFWYDVTLVAAPPAAVATLSMESVVRQAVARAVVLQNPLDTSVLFRVVLDGPGLTGATSIVVPARSSSEYMVTFAPTCASRDFGQVIFRNEQLGEFVYDVELLAQNPPPVELEDLTCALGETSHVIVPVFNPLQEDIELEVHLAPSDAVRDFLLVHGGQEVPMHGSILVAAGATVDLTLFFMASSLGPTATVELRVSHARLGEWTYRVRGVGVKPALLRPLVLHGAVGETCCAVLRFKNPFFAATKLHAALLTPIRSGEAASKWALEALKHRSGGTHRGTGGGGGGPKPSSGGTESDVCGVSVTVGPRASVELIVRYTPAVMLRDVCMLGMVVESDVDVFWACPVVGVPESEVCKDARLITCRAGDRLEEALEVELPGVATSGSSSAIADCDTSWVTQASSVFGIERAKQAASQALWMNRSEMERLADSPFGLLSASRERSAGPLDDTASDQGQEQRQRWEKDGFVHFLRARDASLRDVFAVVREPGSGGAKLQFRAVFRPTRMVQAGCELIVEQRGGGVWRYPMRLVASGATADDTIELIALVHGRTAAAFKLTSCSDEALPFRARIISVASDGSSRGSGSGVGGGVGSRGSLGRGLSRGDASGESVFSVEPSGGSLLPASEGGTKFVVSYAPQSGQRTHRAQLVVSAGELQWTYHLIGRASVVGNSSAIVGSARSLVGMQTPSETLPPLPRSGSRKGVPA